MSQYGADIVRDLKKQVCKVSSNRVNTVLFVAHLQSLPRFFRDVYVQNG